MKKKLIYTLFLTGITLSTSSCGIIDTDAVSNAWNAFTLARTASFVFSNWEGLAVVFMITGIVQMLKAGKHKQYRLWLSRSIAVFLLMATIIMTFMFYMQYREYFKSIYDAMT